jgi:hypothetical protein
MSLYKQYIYFENNDYMIKSIAKKCSGVANIIQLINISIKYIRPS